MNVIVIFLSPLSLTALRVGNGVSNMDMEEEEEEEEGGIIERISGMGHENWPDHKTSQKREESERKRRVEIAAKNTSGKENPRWKKSPKKQDRRHKTPI